MGKKSKREGGKKRDKIGDPRWRTRMSSSPLAEGWTLRFDGGCEGNGRPDAIGRWGCIITAPDGSAFLSDSGAAFGNPVTNNTAEFEGLYEGLNRIPSDATAVRIEGDSQLILFLVTGEWGVKKPEMREWRDRVLSKLYTMGVQWSATWIPREENGDADALTRMMSPEEVERRKQRQLRKKQQKASDMKSRSVAQIRFDKEHELAILKAEYELELYRKKLADLQSSVKK